MQLIVPRNYEQLKKSDFPKLKRNWSGTRYIWYLSMEDQDNLNGRLRKRFESNLVEVNARTGRVESCTWDEYYFRNVEVSQQKAIRLAREHAASNGHGKTETAKAYAELNLGSFPGIASGRVYFDKPRSLLWWSVYLNFGPPDGVVCINLSAQGSGSTVGVAHEIIGETFHDVNYAIEDLIPREQAIETARGHAQEQGWAFDDAIVEHLCTERFSGPWVWRVYLNVSETSEPLIRVDVDAKSGEVMFSTRTEIQGGAADESHAKIA
ncbi:MAG: PepSY domain-containing protein [Armatimonas sp.]